MSKLKSEVKAATLHEVGMKLDDVLEAAERELHTLEGGKQALHMGQKKVEQHLANVDRDVQEGKLDLEQATLIKRWVTQCVHILENLALQAEVQMYQAQGKVVGAKHVVAVAKSLYDREKAHLDALSQAEVRTEALVALEPAEGRQRVVGTHPGDPLAARRAEAAVAKAAEAVKPAEAVAPPAEVKPTPPPAEVKPTPPAEVQPTPPAMAKTLPPVKPVTKPVKPVLAVRAAPLQKPPVLAKPARKLPRKA